VSSSAAEVSSVAMSPGLSVGAPLYFDHPPASDRIEIPILVLGLWPDLVEHSEPPPETTDVITALTIALGGTPLAFEAIPGTADNEVQADHPQTQLAIRNASGSAVDLQIKPQILVRPASPGQPSSTVGPIEITIPAGATVITGVIPAAYKTPTNRVVFDIDSTTSITARAIRPE
jgi:hypothetical protein